MYLTHKEYLTKGGCIANASAFLLYESRARKKLDLYTQNRLQKLAPEQIPEEIKTLMVLLIGELQAREERDRGGISGISNDGYSVSYEKRTETEAASESAILALIREYAAPWCFRGIDRGCGK